MFVGLIDRTALLAVPDDYTKDVVETRVREQVTTALSDQLGIQVRLAVTVDPSLEPAARRRRDPARDRHARPSSRTPTTTSPTRPRRSARVPAGGGPVRPRVAEREAIEVEAARLNPKYTLRHLRHRCEQPVRARGRRRGRRGAGQGLQPAVRLRRVRAGQDPPAARDRALRAQPLPRRAGALRELRGVHQRLHQQHPRRQGLELPAPLPRRRRAADRRHPVPAGQGADAGGVLPHLQHAAQRQQAGGDHLRPAAQAAERLRGAHAQPVRVGPADGRAAPRPRDPDRDPAQEGDPGPDEHPGRGARVHRDAHLDQHP